MSPAASEPAAAPIASPTAAAVASRVRISRVSKPRDSAMRCMSLASASHAFSVPLQPL